MSARLENLQEQLLAIKIKIVEKSKLGQPIEDLVQEEQFLAKQLTRARVLLTENTSVLKG